MYKNLISHCWSNDGMLYTISQPVHVYFSIYIPHVSSYEKMGFVLMYIVHYYI